MKSDMRTLCYCCCTHCEVDNHYQRYHDQEEETPSTMMTIVWTNVRPAFLYTKALFLTLWIFVWSWSNFYKILFRVPQFTVWSFKDRCRQIKNAPLCIPFSLFPTYWIWMLYSYFQLVQLSTNVDLQDIKKQ